MKINKTISKETGWILYTFFIFPAKHFFQVWYINFTPIKQRNENCKDSNKYMIDRITLMENKEMFYK